MAWPYLVAIANVRNFSELTNEEPSQQRRSRCCSLGCFYLRIVHRTKGWTVVDGVDKVVSGRWRGISLVGMEGLVACRPNAADRPDQRGAREWWKVWWTVFAELWRRKRAIVYWSRLEQPEAGAKRNGAEASFRPQSGRSDTKMPSCGRDCTLWTALDGQRVLAVEQPCRRPEDAAVEQCTGQS